LQRRGLPRSLPILPRSHAILGHFWLPLLLSLEEQVLTLALSPRKEPPAMHPRDTVRAGKQRRLLVAVPITAKKTRPLRRFRDVRGAVLQYDGQPRSHPTWSADLGATKAAGFPTRVAAWR
jgi:hypothetical protein